MKNCNLTGVILHTLLASYVPRYVRKLTTLKDILTTICHKTGYTVKDLSLKTKTQFKRKITLEDGSHLKINDGRDNSSKSKSFSWHYPKPAKKKYITYSPKKSLAFRDITSTRESRFLLKIISSQTREIQTKFGFHFSLVLICILFFFKKRTFLLIHMLKRRK